MIERHWKATLREESLDDYIKHLAEETFPLLSTIAGFKKAVILRRSTEEGIEILIRTHWESLESIKKFAGDELDTAVVPLKVQKMTLGYDLKVSHFLVVTDWFKT